MGEVEENNSPSAALLTTSVQMVLSATWIQETVYSARSETWSSWLTKTNRSKAVKLPVHTRVTSPSDNAEAIYECKASALLSGIFRATCS